MRFLLLKFGYVRLFRGARGLYGREKMPASEISTEPGAVVATKSKQKTLKQGGQDFFQDEQDSGLAGSPQTLMVL